jgi:hypothetical protein
MVGLGVGTYLSCSSCFRNRTFPRSPRVTKASHDLALNPRGCRRSGGAGETGQQQEAGGAASAASLFGPMRHERPPPAATAAGAAALHALSNMKRPMPQATRQAQDREAVGGMEAVIDTRKEQVETVTPTGVRATLTTSAVLRFVEQLDKVQPPTDTEVVVSSVMERMVEMVSLQCAGEGGLPEALDEHQQLCFAAEQKQAEQVKVRRVCHRTPPLFFSKHTHTHTHTHTRARTRTHRRWRTTVSIGIMHFVTPMHSHSNP